MNKYFKNLFLAIIITFIFIPSLAAAENQQYRLFQYFVEDAAIVPTQWWEAQFRYISDGQYRSINIPDSDTIAFSPIVAVALRTDFEVGAILSVEDIDYNGWLDSRDGSGLSDTDIYGKYRIKKEPFELTFGALATLPTGNKDDGRGTGKVNVEIFGGARKTLAQGAVISGVLGFRFNQDTTLFEFVDLNAKTSVIIGGGFIYPITNSLAFSGEINVESERYDGIDSDIRVTPGLQFKAFKNSLLRIGAGIGLSDGAPDFEAIFSYAYTF